LFSKIVDIRDQGISIILVEQNAKQAISIADRTYLLENGIVALEGDNTIVNSPILNKVYFGG
jgi:branched-chain amino acid transport system ATP-binding protein